MKNFGIPGSGFEYQNLDVNQDGAIEYFITESFLNYFFDKGIYTIAPQLATPNMSLEFINYGDTQLVYVLTTEKGHYTLLVGQPITRFQQVKEEFDNLFLLAEKNPEIVVKPICYYTNNIKEMYISPYIMQSRCVASQESGLGIYIPEPYYRFELFCPQVQYNINISIIANLVRLYDEKIQLGIADCRMGGGDFILEKDWSYSKQDLEAALKYMKLIAARRMINLNFENYLNILRKEFKMNTYYKCIDDRDNSILVNQKSRKAMTDMEIEHGIQLGLKLKHKIL